MKAVFIHDHNFVFNNVDNLFYDGSGGSFNKDLWSRYLEIFSSLTVVGREIEKLPNNLVLASAEKVNFKLINNTHGIKNIISNRKTIKSELEKIINESEFAIIRLPSLLGSWSVEICKKKGIKYVLEIVGDPFQAYWYHGRILAKIISGYQFIKLFRIVKQSNFVIYVTKNALQKRYPNNYKNLSISNVRLLNTATKSKVKSFYSKEKIEFKIGLIGSFHVKYKGHYEAIKVLSQLKRLGFDQIELHLVGTGNPQWIKELADKEGVADKVKIIGFLEAGEAGIFPFLDNIDLYIHPSKTEGLPRVVIEALSRGKLCLASDVGGTSELLTKDFLHSPSDWKTLLKQVKKLIEIPSKIKLEIALANLKKSEYYLESVLQKKRKDFIQSIIIDESN